LSTSDKQFLPKKFQVFLGKLEPGSLVQSALLFIGMALLLFTRGPSFSGDDSGLWSSLRSLLERGEVGGSGRSFISSLFAVPLYLIGRLTNHVEAVTLYFNLTLFVVVGATILVLLVRRIGWQFARITALLILSASMFPLLLGHFFPEVFTALLVTTGILLVSTRPVFASLLLGLGVANTPALFPGLILASTWMAWRWKKYSLLLLPAPGFALFVGENGLKFGNPILNPYLQGNAGFRTVLPYSGLPGFSYPLVFGVLNIIFSIGKGLLFFIPGLLAVFNKSLLIGPLRPIHVEVEAMLVLVGGMILTYAKWWAWYGGDTWGPRFFLFAFIPAALLLAASFVQITTVKAALLFSIAVLFQTWGTMQSLLYSVRDTGLCGANNGAYELLCWYTPEFSVLFRQFVAGFHGPQPRLLPFAVWCAVSSIYMCSFLLWRVASPVRHRRSASTRTGVPQKGAGAW
jgi:hypothetical protein